MARVNNKIFTVLDIGSTKIVCIIARNNVHGELEVLGLGHQVSNGIRAGIITDINAAETSILGAIHDAERESGINVDNLVISVSGSKVESHVIQMEHDVGGHEITARDLKMISDEACSSFDSEKYDIIHCVPVEYELDSEGGIDDPIGMFGHVIRAKLHVVTFLSTSLINIVNCLGRCHVNVDRCVSSAYASGLACLTEDERDLGSIVIDFGGEHTNLAIFRNGSLINVDSVPLGGVNMSKDIAWGLSTDKVSAERIKTLYGSVMPVKSDAYDRISIPQPEGNTTEVAMKVTKADLTEILQPRMEEILDMIKRRLHESGISIAASSRIVLTGGAAQITGLSDFAENTFGKQIRLAKPSYIAGLRDKAEDPSFATAVGMLKFLTAESADMLNNHNESLWSGGYVGKFVNWLRFG